MILNPALETLDRFKLRKLQSNRLAEVVEKVYEKVPFYRNLLDEAKVTPDQIADVADLPRLPFTRKDHLRQTYPFGLLAVEKHQLARIHTSSGTTGKPIVAGYTTQDLDHFAEVNARSLAAAGAKPGDLLHNAYGYGLFTGGLGLHGGGERLGLTVVPVSGGMTERQITLIQDLKPRILCATPSYAQTLAETFRQKGIEAQEISLQYALLGAEPWTESVRLDVDSGLGVTSTNIYGLTEIIGPGVAQECIEGRAGSHVWEDHFYPEIVDRATGLPLPDGKEGVLVLTTLTKQAMPLLRYWTGDITSLLSSPCICGRTHRRIAPIRGRTDDMLIIRGVNLYPTQLESVLAQISQVSPHYQLLVTRQGYLDKLQLKLEISEDFFREVGKTLLARTGMSGSGPVTRLRRQIQKTIKETVGLNIDVALVAPGELPRSEGGKLARVLDLRKN